MGFGTNAYTIASHFVMVLVLTVTIIRLMRTLGMSRDGVPRWLFPGPISMFLATLIVERLYYILARFLRDSGVDLWAAHPAPALLSAIVAGAGYWITPAIFRAYGMERKAIRRRVSMELAGLGGVWLLLSKVLV